MNWISYPETKPKASQPYLISVTRPYLDGDLTFNYIAMYNVETNEWFKYNPFEDNSTGEKMNLKVNGWVEDLTTYIR